MILTENINFLWTSMLIEELIRNDINYFCISSGSRSAPLTYSVVLNEKAETIMCYDERGAAFHAIAYARATGKPAVLICTSGTAVANYLPAIVEAKADMLPVIILSADRPPELLDVGANQTINQKDIFMPFLNWKADIPCPDEKIMLEYLLTTVDQAVFRARRKPSGPVHLNCMFREPLAPSKQKISINYLNSANKWQQSKRNYTDYKLPVVSISKEEIEGISRIINKSNKCIIVIGKLNNNDEKKSVINLVQNINLPVFPDILSGIRSIDSANFINYYDQILLSHSALDYKPDTIIHIGGKITSKRLNEFIKKVHPDNYILLAEHPNRHDPMHEVTLRIESDILEFCENISTNLHPNFDKKFNEFWSNALIKCNEIIEDFTENSEELNEIFLSRSISELIPEGHGLFIASSMPIRDMDMYYKVKGHITNIAGNRGASGIDGVIASACGFAVGLDKPITLLSGDLSALHDLNSLYMINKIKQQIILIIINNQGGGIFSFLPIAEFENVFEKYFGTVHELDFKHSAMNFHIEYELCDSIDEFKNAYQIAINSGKSKIIEVKTLRQKNYDIHQALQNKIKKAITEM